MIDNNNVYDFYKSQNNILNIKRQIMEEYFEYTYPKKYYNSNYLIQETKGKQIFNDLDPYGEELWED